MVTLDFDWLGMHLNIQRDEQDYDDLMYPISKGGFDFFQEAYEDFLAHVQTNAFCELK